MKFFTIEIKTKESFQNVLKHPRLYGFISLFGKLSISFRFPEEYGIMVKALEMDSRRERLAYIYDHACDRIDQYNEAHGLMCSFHDSKCGIPPKEGRINGCCYRCRYQSSKGCPSRNLTCKFYFCDRMRKKHPLTPKDFPEFQILSLRQQYIIRNNAYCKREVFLRLLDLGSIVIFLLYSTRKVFDMEIAEGKNRRLEKK